MIEVPQQLHLSQRSETEHGVIEWSDLLDCDLLLRWLVDGRAIHPRSACAIAPKNMLDSELH
jgi:hypothetical protein